MASVALQGLTPERLAAVLGGDVSLAEARKMVSAVHRCDHSLAPAPAAPQLEGVRNVSLARLAGRVHVGRLAVAAKQASAVEGDGTTGMRTRRARARREDGRAPRARLRACVCCLHTTTQRAARGAARRASRRRAQEAAPRCADASKAARTNIA